MLGVGVEVGGLPNNILLWKGEERPIKGSTKFKKDPVSPIVFPLYRQSEWDVAEIVPSAGHTPATQEGKQLAPVANWPPIKQKQKRKNKKWWSVLDGVLVFKSFGN